MPKETLKRNLARLNEELAASDTLDAKTRAQLSQVVDDIEQLLADEGGDGENIGRRIAAAAYRFEAGHPNLARIMSEVTDALAKLGV